MIEGLRQYARMKESGLPWLGLVPAHWEVRRNGRLFGPRRENGFPDLPILEVSIRTGVRIRDLEVGARKQQMADRSKYQRAVRGDIAYNMMRMWQARSGSRPGWARQPGLRRRTAVPGNRRRQLRLSGGRRQPRGDSSGLPIARSRRHHRGARIRGAAERSPLAALQLMRFLVDAQLPPALARCSPPRGTRPSMSPTGRCKPRLTPRSGTTPCRQGPSSSPRSRISRSARV